MTIGLKNINSIELLLGRSASNLVNKFLKI